MVGNEAVDQLTKFNQAMADHSNSTNPHLIDGIVLTKFDTIDDKVINDTSSLYNYFISYKSNLGIFLIGWCGNFNDVHHRSTDRIRWNWPNLYRFKGIECKSSRSCFDEVNCQCPSHNLFAFPFPLLSQSIT